MKEVQQPAATSRLGGNNGRRQALAALAGAKEYEGRAGRQQKAAKPVKRSAVGVWGMPTAPRRRLWLLLRPGASMTLSLLRLAAVIAGGEPHQAGGLMRIPPASVSTPLRQLPPIRARCGRHPRRRRWADVVVCNFRWSWRPQRLVGDQGHQRAAESWVGRAGPQKQATASRGGGAVGVWCRPAEVRVAVLTPR